MSFDEAIKIMEQLASVYKGTYQEHQILREAIQVLKSKGE
jgi:hypothetical protein